MCGGTTSGAPTLARQLQQISHQCACAVYAGQTAAAAELYGNWTAAWDRFGWLPEQFDMTMSTVHPIEKVRSSLSPPLIYPKAASNGDSHA